jgi:hypothetical protein
MNITIPDAAIHNYFNNFIYNLDPNDATGTKDDQTYLEWPQWSVHRQMVNFSSQSTTLTTDNFRANNYKALLKYTSRFRM